MPEVPANSRALVQGVVIACVRDDGRLLAIRRSRHVKLAPLKVCFPGGTIEPGESQRDAAVREMHEELGVAIEPQRCVWEWDHPDRPLKLWGWTASLLATTFVPEPREVDEVLWLTPDEIAAHHEGLLSNRFFVQSILRAWETAGR